MPLDSVVRRLISESLAPLKASFDNSVADTHSPVPEIRWVKSENWHVTLAFLGQVSEEKASYIKKLLVSCLSTTKSFEAELSTIRGFPYPNSRIIAAVFTNNEAFQRLYGQVQDMCQIAGLRQDPRAFKPHITLARTKNPADYKNNSRHERKLRRSFGMPCLQLDTEITLDRVRLYESHLRPEGSSYETLAEILLAT